MIANASYLDEAAEGFSPYRSGITATLPKRATPAAKHMEQETMQGLQDHQISRALRLLGLTYLISFASLGIQVPLLTPAMTTLGYTAAVIGGFWAIRSAVSVFGPALWGTLADRFGGGKRWAAFSLIGAGLSMAGLGFLEGESGESELLVTALFAAYGLVGTASVSLLDGLVLTALGNKKERYGNIRVWGVLGFGLGAVIATQVSEHFPHWATPTPVFVSAGFLAVLAGGTVLLSPELPRVAPVSLPHLFSILRRSGLGLIGLIAVLHWAGHGAYTAFITPLAVGMGLLPSVVGLALAISIMVEMVAMRSAAWAQERFTVPGLLVLVCAVAVVRWLALGFSHSVVGFVFLQALHGVTFGWFYPTVVTAIAARVPDEARQGAQGVFTSGTFGVGGAIGMAVAGYALADFGPAMAWWTMAILGALALGFACAFFIVTRASATRLASRN